MQSFCNEVARWKAEVSGCLVELMLWGVCLWVVNERKIYGRHEHAKSETKQIFLRHNLDFPQFKIYRLRGLTLRQSLLPKIYEESSVPTQTNGQNSYRRVKSGAWMASFYLKEERCTPFLTRVALCTSAELVDPSTRCYGKIAHKKNSLRPNIWRLTSTIANVLWSVAGQESSLGIRTAWQENVAKNGE